MTECTLGDRQEDSLKVLFVTLVCESSLLRSGTLYVVFTPETGERCVLYFVQIPLSFDTISFSPLFSRETKSVWFSLYHKEKGLKYPKRS